MHGNTKVKLLGKVTNQEQGCVKDKKGNLVTEKKKVLQIWAECFDELLNGHGNEDGNKGDGDGDDEGETEDMRKTVY